jgi:hypothetical protein
MPPLSLTGTTFSASFSSSSSFSLLKCKGLHHRRRLSSPHCVVFFGVPRTSRIRRRKHTNTNWKNKAATLRSSKNDSFFFNDDENENENETNENTNEENVEDDDFEAKVVAENETFFFEEASSSSVPSPADLNDNLLQKANASSSSSSVWKTKPFWCQPWTIVLFGVFCVSLPTLVFDWKFVSVAVAVPISAWWYVFLVLYPKSYASSSFEEKEEDFGR